MHKETTINLFPNNQIIEISKPNPYLFFMLLSVKISSGNIPLKKTRKK